MLSPGVPCPDCQGQGIDHCCSGDQEQPTIQQEAEGNYKKFRESLKTWKPKQGKEIVWEDWE